MLLTIIWLDMINLISGIFILTFVVSGFSIVILKILYECFGFGKKLFHNILGCCLPDKSRWHDGCSMHSCCKYCGKDIMQDSYGQWF